jgi:hypothetical protein
MIPKFQDFLLSHSLVSAINVPFYAHWVHREAKASPTLSLFSTISGITLDINFA